jgi:MinD-like ATPase involved in chromosome partitioning or flagellar assembly
VRGARPLKRRDLYPGPLIDGREPHDHALERLKRRIDSLLVSPHERDEAELERRLRVQPGVTRPNLVAVASPKGGVGKTTITFLAGNLLASHLKLRAIAVDATPGFGTLGRLPNDRARAARSLAELLEDAERIGTAAELRPYVSRLPSGLHVLAAPSDTARAVSLGPIKYGELVALLSCFYETVLLDVGGVTGPLARFALARADQVVLVTTPEGLTAGLVIDALDHLKKPATVVVNKAHPQTAAELRAIDECLRLRGLHLSVPIPHDGRLATMLGTGTYSLEALDRRTRLPVKRLGVAVADRLV